VLVLRRVWLPQESAHGLRFSLLQPNVSSFTWTTARRIHYWTPQHQQPGSTSCQDFLPAEVEPYPPKEYLFSTDVALGLSEILDNLVASSLFFKIFTLQDHHEASSFQFWICVHHHPKGKKKASTLFLARCSIHPPVLYIPGLAPRLPDATIIGLIPSEILRGVYDSWVKPEDRPLGIFYDELH